MKRSKRVVLMTIAFMAATLSLFAQTTYYYTWGGTETEPQAALISSDNSSDNLWAIRIGGCSEGGLAAIFLEANDSSEACPDLTLTIPAGSVDSGNYAVYQINATTAGFRYHCNVDGNVSGEYRRSDVMDEWRLIGTGRSDATTDIVVNARHVQMDPASPRTRLDAIKLVKIDDLYYVWGGHETSPQSALSWSYVGAPSWDMKYMARDDLPAGDPMNYTIEGNLPLMFLELDLAESQHDGQSGTTSDLVMTIPGDTVPAETYTVWAYDGGFASRGYEIRIPGGGWVSVHEYAPSPVWRDAGSFVHNGVADIVIDSRAQNVSVTDRYWFWGVKLLLEGASPSPSPSATPSATPSSTPEPSSSPIPGSDIVNPIWGVNIHARYSPQEADMVDDLGTPMVVFSYEWEQIEQTEGVYTYEPPPGWEFVWESTMTAEEFLIYADAYGIRLNWLLQLGTWDIAGTPNEWYLTPAEQATITSSKKIQDVYGTSATFMNAFGDYCYEVSNHFGSNGLDLVHDWELWGEPNSSHPDRPAAADVYMNLINVAVPRLREGDPLGKISGPNVSRMDFPFLERCLERGLADLVDRISIHPYREWTYPEDTDGNGGGNTYAEQIAYLRSRIEVHSPGSDVEIAVTEWGYSTGFYGITELDKAKYLARFAIQNLGLGIDLFLWYHLGGDGFALRSLAGEWYYDSYYTFQRVMEHFSGELRILDVDVETSVSVPGLHSYSFMNENEELLVCFWQAIDAVDSYSGIVTDVTFTFSGLDTDSEDVEFINLVTGSQSIPSFVRDGSSITFQSINISDSPKIIKVGTLVVAIELSLFELY